MERKNLKEHDAWMRAAITIRKALRERSSKVTCPSASWAMASICTELVSETFKFLDHELQRKMEDLYKDGDNGGAKTIEYYRNHVRPVFETLLMPVLWHQPENLLGYIQQQIGTAQFKLELQAFLGKCRDAADVRRQQVIVEEQSEDFSKESADAHHHKLARSESGPIPATRQKGLERVATRVMERRATTLDLQGFFAPGSVSAVDVNEMYERAFQDAGGHEALQEGRRMHNLQQRTQAFTGGKRPRQNKEYDVLSMSEFFHEATQKNFRFNMILKELAEQIGGRHTERPLKTIQTADIKIALKHGTGLRHLLDVVSSAIVFPDISSLYDGLSQMLDLNRKDFLIRQLKDRILKPTGTGHRDVKLFVEVDGMICELHLLLAPMLQVLCVGHQGRLQKDASELLLFSSMRNYEHDAQRLLELEADPNLNVDLHGRSCLHHAASQNQQKFVNRLLDARANPLCEDMQGAMPWQRALRKGHYKVAEALLRYTENCFSTLTDEGRFQAKKTLEWWIDVMRYDKRMRNGSSVKILKHLANMGPDLRPVLNSALFPLIIDGDQDQVELLFNAKANVNAKQDGQSVLDAALDSPVAGAKGMVPWFVKQGAFTLKKRQWRQKDLFDAADEWDLERVECLWEQGVNLGCEDAKGSTIMDLLLKVTKIPIVLRPRVGDKALACRWVQDDFAKYSGEKKWRAHRHPEACIVLDADDEGLQVRFNFDQEEQYLPYEHLPDQSKQLKLLTWLAEHGTPAKQRWLHSEIMVGDKEKVKFLLQIHADVHLRDNYQRTPLHVAAAYGRDTICQWLLQAHACVNQVDQLRQTPLFGAKTAAVARRLLEATADLHVRDQNQNSPMHTASCEEIVSLLFSRQASLESRNIWGEVPLHSAARGAKLQVVVKLLALRASPDVIDDRNQTALHVAADQNTARGLVEAGMSHELLISAADQHRRRTQDPRLGEQEREQASNIVSWLQKLMQAGDGRGSDVRKVIEDSRRQNGNMQRSDSAPVLRRPKVSTGASMNPAVHTDFGVTPKSRKHQTGHWSEKALGSRTAAVLNEIEQDRVFVPF